VGAGCRQRGVLGAETFRLVATLAAPAAAPRQVAPADPVAIARFLGSTPAAAGAEPARPTALASRMQLLGVAAGAHSGKGAAVISVDGKPPRSYRVGSVIDEGYVLKSVHGRQAVIASQQTGQPVATLELPAPRLDASRPAPMAVPPRAPGVAGGPGVAGAPEVESAPGADRVPGAAGVPGVAGPPGVAGAQGRRMAPPPRPFQQ